MNFLIQTAQTYQKELSISLLIAGSVLMLFGLIVSLQILALLKKNKSEAKDLFNGYAVFYLILFFQIGYFLAIFLIYNNIVSILVTLMGVIFFLGAVFVVLINYLSKKTLSLEIKRKNSFERFVPKEFLQQLAKKDITDIQLGDQIEKEVAVMIVDIRSFSKFADAMKPHEVFQLLNEYLENILPIIKNNFGFVDKFLGDGLLVIFPKQATHSIQCGIDIFASLKKWNDKKINRPSINIGIAINYGKVIFGTIGSHDRMENTVISNIVNMVSRLERLNKKLGTKIIVSKKLMKFLGNTHLSRPLGKIYLRGRDQPIETIEIYNVDSEEQIQLKNKTAQLFQKALEYLAHKDIAEAKKAFATIHKMNPLDEVTKFYLNYCEQQS